MLRLPGMSDAAVLVRTMKDEDAERVAELSAAVFPAPHEAANRHDVAAVREELARSIACLYVLEVAKSIEGFFVGWIVAGELQVLSIAVAGTHRKRGLGRAFLSHVLEKARDKGVTFATLELRDDNAAALALYAGIGFREVGRRARYYADGAAAVLMQYDLPSSTIEA